jgi:hypothetical protein
MVAAGVSNSYPPKPGRVRCYDKWGFYAFDWGIERREKTSVFSGKFVNYRTHPSEWSLRPVSYLYQNSSTVYVIS